MKYKALLFSTVLVLALSIGVVKADTKVLEQGYCGAEVFWTLDNDGLLTISGSGNMYDNYHASYAPWDKYSNLIKKVVIEEGITKIGDRAFTTCTNITDIILPEGLYYIGDSAFGGNKETLKLPSSIQAIGDGNKFKNVYISDLKNWCNIDFGGPVATNLYVNDELLTDLVIPKGVIEIGQYVFQGNEGIKSISRTNNVVTISDYAFSNNINLENVVLNNSVRHIGIYSFYNCYFLSQITLPEKLQTIGIEAFYGCTSLKSITIPNNVKDMGWGAFKYCEGLTDVVISEGVTQISGFTFLGCTRLKNIKVPSSIDYIGDGAFFDCVALETIELPTDMAKCVIENNTFYNCKSLTNITIPDGIISIGSGAFENCSGLNEIIIPDSVETIGDDAFKGCNATIYAHTMLANQLITSGATNISYYHTVRYYNDNVEIAKENVLNGADAKLIDEEGYTTEYYVDGILWDGKAVTSDITVSVVRNRNEYRISYTGDYIGHEIVKHGDNANKLEDNLLMGYWYSYEANGMQWTGESIKAPITVVVTKNIVEYKVTYIGAYFGTDTVKHENDVVLPASNKIGYHYTFTINGEQWQGTNIVSDVTVTVTEEINVYKVSYTGAINYEISVKHGEDIELPICSYEGYHYEFVADGLFWNGKNITAPASVYVTRKINVYTVIFIGDYNREYLVTHGDFVPYPVSNKTGYHYNVELNGERWTGGAITDNLTITVTEGKNIYTVSFMGDYEKIVDVYHGDNVTLPIAPDGYAYKFYVDDVEWTGENITDYTNVNVVMLYDGCDVTDILSMHDIDIKGEIITCKCYYAQVLLNVSVSKEAKWGAYSNAECTTDVNSIYFGQTGQKKVFYIKVTAQSGRTKIYTVTAEREYITTLGQLEFSYSSGGSVTLKMAEPIPGEPEIYIYYSNINGNWILDKDARYDNITQLVKISGLEEATRYWVKIKANYGDMPYAESNSVEFTTTDLLSSECDIISVYVPGNAQINENECTIYSKVENAAAYKQIEVEVSEGATWDVYRTEYANIPIENKTVALREGRNVVVYIRVTAEDGYTQKTYALTIYRQKKSAKPVISCSNGYITIQAPLGSIIRYTTDNSEPEPDTANIYNGPFIASEGTTIKAIALNPEVEEYSDVVIYHVNLTYQTEFSVLYFDPVIKGYEWSAYITTENPAGITGSLIIALYDDKMNMLDIKIEPVSSILTECEAYGDFETGYKATYCKMFFWDSINTIRPIAKSQPPISIYY